MDGMEIERVTTELASALNETAALPIQEIRDLVTRYGRSFTDQILTETIQVQKQGGLSITSGRRQRTIGGVFFYLAYQKVPRPPQPQSFSNQHPAPSWETSLNTSRNLITARQTGEGNVKATVIGRPLKVERVDNSDAMTAIIEYTIKASLPKGLPPPPTTRTQYIVYMTSKQWRKNEKAMQHPQDLLIVEGYGVYSPELNGMVIYALSVTTRLTQQKIRQAADENAPAK